ncbi:MAG: hypothetical protein QOK25_2616 [Thermoleophilaceae bacterium]|nr:hypothetical protein [Thermoleophilaceae bacterium]
MAILTAVLTHLDAAAVERQLSYLHSLAPESRFVVCHGGRRTDFDALETGDALFIDDPSLRGPHFDQSMNQILQAVFEGYVRDDPAVELVYLIEYDHLILRGDFEQKLQDLASLSSAGLFAKNATPRNDTNWSHYLKIRDDGRLERFVRGISVRDDPGVRWGSLGPGMLFRRDALAAFCALHDPPPYYFELFVPTVVHHLGFGVADIDAISDLYMAVRWLPEWSVEEAIAEKRAGRTFVHPFKRLDRLPAIRQAAAPGA